MKFWKRKTEADKMIEMCKESLAGIDKYYVINSHNEVTELADYIYFGVQKSIGYDKAQEIALNLYSVGYRKLNSKEYQVIEYLKKEENK